MAMQIGRKIKELRRRKQVSQEKLAERLNVSFQAVSKWENEVTLPDVTLVPVIAEYFGVSTDELLGVNRMETERRITEICEASWECRGEDPARAERILRDGLQRYPGNDRVTLIGEDAYQWGAEEDFVKQLTADLDFLSVFAKRNGKLLAMTECGFKNTPDPTWWTRVLKPVMDKYPLCYFLTWRNYSKEYFGPSKDEPSGADFKKLYEAGNTLFLKDIAK